MVLPYLMTIPLRHGCNVTLSFETVASADQETFLSTAFAGGDVPDLITLSSKEMGFTLGGQGLLVDAKDMYPYMPQTQKFVTKTLLQYSTMEDGTIPFVTKYAIQDGDIWNLAIRQDWLDNLGMEMPTTEEELLEYAKACTFNDPDGNGQDDTYFMLGAGGGSGLGMLDWLWHRIRQPQLHRWRRWQIICSDAERHPQADSGIYQQTV